MIFVAVHQIPETRSPPLPIISLRLDVDFRRKIRPIGPLMMAMAGLNS